MKLSMTVTLDGLVRALRWKEHDLVERAGRNLATSPFHAKSVRGVPTDEIPTQARMSDNDRSGR